MTSEMLTVTFDHAPKADNLMEAFGFDSPGKFSDQMGALLRADSDTKSGGVISFARKGNISLILLLAAMKAHDLRKEYQSAMMGEAFDEALAELSEDLPEELRKLVDALKGLQG